MEFENCIEVDVEFMFIRYKSKSNLDTINFSIHLHSRRYCERYFQSIARFETSRSHILMKSIPEIQVEIWCPSGIIKNR